MLKGLNWELIPVAGKLLETVDLCWIGSSKNVSCE